nr:VanZ family protein [Kribbella sandramycini]
MGVVGQCGTHLATTGGLTSVQGLLNVLLFVPAAALLALASNRPGDGIAAGIGLSASVEAIQALLPTLGRSCQLHDLIANTAGAFAGVALALGLKSVTRGRRLVTNQYVVEHTAMVVIRPRPPARHRRDQLAPRPVPIVAKSTNGLRPVVRAR